jgi:hypothetical protein
MKVSRPHGAPSAGSAAKAPGPTGPKGKGFATKLDQAERLAGTRDGVDPSAGSRRTSAVSDIGVDFKAGKITAETAIDRVVERVLDRQLGKKATIALREKVGAALRDSLADDPLLAAKVKALSSE